LVFRTLRTVHPGIFVVRPLLLAQRYVHWPAVGDEHCSTRLLLGHADHSLLLASQLAEVLKVTLRNVCYVFAVEEPDFEVFHLALAVGRLNACGLEVLQTLKDDFISIDIPSDFLPRPSMSKELYGSMSAELEKIGSNSHLHDRRDLYRT
jgi:hypothetical protein